MTAAPEQVPVGCGLCGNPSALLACQRCKTTLFCDAVCQKRAWPVHKLNCETLEDRFAKYDKEQEQLEQEEIDRTCQHQREVEEAAAKEKEMAATLEAFFSRGSSKKKAESTRPDWLPRKEVQQAPEGELQQEAAPAQQSGKVTEGICREICVTDTELLPCDFVSLPIRGGGHVDMPRVMLGTGGYEGLSGRVGRAAILAALKMGYRGIDTSEMNRNLTDIRWACKRSGLAREDYFLVVKIPPWSHGHDGVLQSFRRQTSQLAVDYVDLLLIQWPHVWSLEQRDWGPAQWSRAGQTKASLRGETWRAMEELLNSGRARAIGVSNHTIEDMEAILHGCAVAPMVMQGESHPHWPNRSVRDWCRKQSIAFQGYAPFGGQETERNSGHRPVDDPTVLSVAEKRELTPFQVCMQWNQARNSSTVVKSKDSRHLRENLAACGEMRCTATDLGRIDERAKEFLKYGPCYWGHNDMDYLHPWKDEEKMWDAMLPGGQEVCGRI